MNLGLQSCPSSLTTATHKAHLKSIRRPQLWSSEDGSHKSTTLHIRSFVHRFRHLNRHFKSFDQIRSHTSPRVRVQPRGPCPEFSAFLHLDEFRPFDENLAFPSYQIHSIEPSSEREKFHSFGIPSLHPEEKSPNVSWESIQFPYRILLRIKGQSATTILVRPNKGLMNSETTRCPPGSRFPSLRHFLFPYPAHYM